MKINDVRDKISSLHAEEVSLNAAVVDNNPTSEQIERFNRIDSDIVGQKVILRSLERSQEQDRIAAEARIELEAIERGSTNDGEIARVAKSHFLGYLRGDSPQAMSTADRAILKVAIERGQVVGVDSKGGFTAPKYFSSEVIKTVKHFGGMTESVFSFTTSDGNEINFSTLDDTARKALLVAEVAAPGAAEIAYGRISMKSFKYSAGKYRISSELLRDTIVDVEADMIMAMSDAYARAFNEHFTMGTGTNQPQGILSASAALAFTTAAAAALTMDNMIDVMYSVDKAYRANAMFMFNDKTEAVLRKIKDTTGQPIWNSGDYAKGIAPTILGKPYAINSDMEDVATGKRSVAFGDFKKGYRARYVQNLSVRRLEELYAETDEIGMVSFMSIDGKVFDPSAIKLIKHA